MLTVWSLGFLGMLDGSERVCGAETVPVPPEREHKSFNGQREVNFKYFKNVLKNMFIYYYYYFLNRRRLLTDGLPQSSHLDDDPLIG